MYRSLIKLKTTYIVFIIGGVVALIVLLSAMIFSNSNSLNTDTVVMEINDEPITYKEYNRYLIENRSTIYAYFNRNYDLTESSPFWTSSFEGEIPLERLKQIALEQLVDVRVQLGILRKEGFIDDISYSSFEKRWKNENKRREVAVRNGEIIYGPIQYSESEYFHYEFSNLVLEMIHKIAGKEGIVTKSQLQDYYEENKEQLYKKGSTIEIVTLTALQMDGELREQTKDRLVDYQLKLDKGQDIQSLIEEANQLGIVVKERTFDENSYREDMRFSNETYMNAVNLNVGDYSDIFEDEGNITFVYCVTRKPNGYESYEEVANQVKLEYIKQQYEDEVEKQAELVTIIKKDAFDNISMK